MQVPDLEIDYSKVTLWNTHMRYVARKLETVVREASRHSPAVVITGPRRAGKDDSPPPVVL
jgi:predicted AAA+ superfamily ATPase